VQTGRNFAMADRHVHHDQRVVDRPRGNRLRGGRPAGRPLGRQQA
jgi:hypothetical protein